MIRSEKHVVVLGGGLIGFSAAYHLLRKGIRVTVLERNHEATASCSTGNAGMVVPSHFIPLAAPGMIGKGLRWMLNPESPFSIRPQPSLELLSWGWKFYRASQASRVERAMPTLRDLSFRSREIFSEMADSPKFDFGLKKRGLLMLCKTQKGLAHEIEIARTANSIGVQAEVLDGKGVQEVDPSIKIDVAGGVYFEQDCHLDPAQFLQDLRQQVLVMGGKIEWQSEVKNFRKTEKRIQSAKLKNGKEIEGDSFVLCNGAWAASTGKKLALNLPMQAGKGYSVTHPNPPASPEVCALLSEARVAVTPIGNQLRIGGTMEIIGLDESVNQRRLDGIFKSIHDYYPQLEAADFKGLEVWKGLRPCSPDGMPYIGKTERWENLIVATGHSMLGLSLSPVTGEIVAALLTGEALGYDMELLKPERYG